MNENNISVAEEMAKNIIEESEIPFNKEIPDQRILYVAEAVLSQAETIRRLMEGLVMARKEFYEMSDVEVEEEPGVLTWESNKSSRAMARIDELLKEGGNENTK